MAVSGAFAAATEMPILAVKNVGIQHKKNIIKDGRAKKKTADSVFFLILAFFYLPQAL